MLHITSLASASFEMHHLVEQFEGGEERRTGNVMIIPEEFHCPITHEIMKDPVMTSDGHSYERTAITDWFQQIQNSPHNSSSSTASYLLTSPQTNEPLQSHELYPNHALRNIIEKYSENNLLIQQSLSEIKEIQNKLEKAEKSIRQQLSLDSNLQKQLLEHISTTTDQQSKPKPQQKAKTSSRTSPRSHESSSSGDLDTESAAFSVIESVITKERDHLNEQKHLLIEKFAHTDQEEEKLSAQKENIKSQLLDQRSTAEIREMEQRSQEEILELRRIQSNIEQEMTQLANEYRKSVSRALGQSYEVSDAILETVREHCERPQASPLLSDYAACEIRYQHQQRVIDRTALSSQNEIQPLREAYEANRSSLNAKLEELEKILLPSLLSERETLRSQVGLVEQAKEALDDLKKDFQDSLHWAKISANGFYEPSMQTLSTVLLCFKVHSRLELQSGKGKNALKTQGLTPTRLRRWGCTVKELKNAGFSPQDLRDGHFTVREMRKEGYSLHDLIQCGFPPKELEENGFSARDLLAAGVSRDQLDEVGLEIEDEQERPVLGSDQRKRSSPQSQQQIVTSRKRSRQREYVVCGAGDEEEEEEEEDLGNEESARSSPRGHNSSHPSSSSSSSSSSSPGLPLYTFLELRTKRLHEDFTAAEAREAHCQVKSLKEAGFSCRQIYLGGYSTEEMMKDGITKRAIERVRKSAQELREKGFPARDLHTDGFLAEELYEAGYSYEDLQGGGYSATDLKNLGCPLARMIPYTKKRLLEAGYTEEEVDPLYRK
jgi:hypothetical protein